MNDLKQFIKSYWEYFLELEEQFLETKRFVEFDKGYNNRPAIRTINRCYCHKCIFPLCCPPK